MAKAQENLNKQGQKYIQGWQNTVRHLWVKMCEKDGISSDCKFVIFNDNNKYLPFYHNALIRLNEARTQYRDGGYVGLQIIDGRAR